MLTYKYLEKNGRLGNQIWQIASTTGIAQSRGDIARFPKWEYQRYFRVPEELFVDPLPAGEDMGTDYLQELHYFKDIERKVWSWFQPQASAVDELHRRHPWIGSGHLTSLHFRRGDYLKHPDHFPLPSLGYYSRACAAILDEHPDTTFLVFSDDIRWCRHNLDDFVFHGAPVRFIEGVTRPVEVADRVGEPEDQYDLFLMSLCDRHIISNSTFAWWGAYLSLNQRVIYPSVWFGPALNYQRCPAPETWIEFDSC